MVSKEAQSDTHTVTEAGLYRRMLLIRGFEELRAVPVPARRGVRDDASLLGPGGGGRGLRERLADGDRVACTYRGHGHTFAHGRRARRRCWRSCSAARRGSTEAAPAR